MGTPGKRTVSRAEYRNYINSSAWRAVRDRYWNSKMPKNCYVCDAERAPGMHLHHRTYKNLGAERLMDLTPVCPECHKLIHHVYDTSAVMQRKGLWYATKRARKLRRAGQKK